MTKGLLLSLLILVCAAAAACPVAIRIQHSDGKPASGIDVFVDGILKGSTNSAGVLNADLANGEHKLVLRRHTAVVKQTSVHVNCATQGGLYIELTDAEAGSVSLKDVTVKALSAKETIDLSPFSVQAIDLKNSYDKGGDVSEFLNRASGVRLRSDGSVGAQVQVNLGGLQGKAVRLFRDGIPVELFGHAFSLGTIPVNMLDRIEVYKGVMPLYLAADALGGGVNLVSRKDTRNLAEVSYETGSFNTHRATFNGLWKNKARTWYVGTSSSFNFADNNYKVNVPALAGSFKDVRRFHDATRSYYIEGYAGIQNKSWADDLRLTLIGADFFKEIQHDAKMDKVYGQAFSREHNYTALLNYKKAFFNSKLKVNAVGTYSFFDTRFVDTATVRYNWDGDIIGRNLRPGEVNLGNNQQIDYNFVSARLNLSYDLTARHAVDFSSMYYQQNRKGSDPLGAITALEAIDVLSVPATYRKDNTALGLRSSWLGKEMESIVALKYYHYKSIGYTTDNFGMGYRSAGSEDQLGYLGGLRWSRGSYLLKASYEYATRLPDEYEVFGDARLVKENMNLRPEKSHNINLNGEYRLGSADRLLTLSAGLFYRKVKDGIFLQLDIPFNRFINYESTRVKGFEVEGSYVAGRHVDFGANLTYQDIRQVNIPEAIFRILEGSRVPNVPYFFGNFWLNTHFNDVLRKGDRIEFNWNGNYTHRFFLQAIPKDQEPGLFEKVTSVQTSLIIPHDGRFGQLNNNAGIYYHFAGSGLSLSGECRNIGNARLYDNFNVQRPGRAFYLKLLYNFYKP
ncbi:TonB-dependent receptor plug domain-containing protein [Pedobacter yulinensis]|uniref:TonB-dependent receptor plug domain-containing protein n=1 Tax=Pedobacter yulinensis TaxID=2126353 RepID=UPI00195513F6|nr:TonB-dependent receptor plug domain-containing protein [Pedobacter yulinensis]